MSASKHKRWKFVVRRKEDVLTLRIAECLREVNQYDTQRVMKAAALLARQWNLEQQLRKE